MICEKWSNGEIDQNFTVWSIILDHIWIWSVGFSFKNIQSESSDEISNFLFFTFAFAFITFFFLKKLFSNLQPEVIYNLPFVYINNRVIFVVFRRLFWWGNIFAQKNLPHVDVKIFELLIVHSINFWELILQYFSPCKFEFHPIFEQTLRLKCYFELHYDIFI